MKDRDGVYLSQHHTDWRLCPYCGALHDAATGVNDKPGATPDDQDTVLICFDCGEFGMADSTAEGNWRKPTFTERQKILDDDNCRLAIAVAREAKGRM